MALSIVDTLGFMHLSWHRFVNNLETQFNTGVRVTTRHYQPYSPMSLGIHVPPFFVVRNYEAKCSYGKSKGITVLVVEGELLGVIMGHIRGIASFKSCRPYSLSPKPQMFMGTNSSTLHQESTHKCLSNFGSPASSPPEEIRKNISSSNNKMIRVIITFRLTIILLDMTMLEEFFTRAFYVNQAGLVSKFMD